MVDDSTAFFSSVSCCFSFKSSSVVITVAFHIYAKQNITEHFSILDNINIFHSLLQSRLLHHLGMEEIESVNILKNSNMIRA